MSCLELCCNLLHGADLPPWHRWTELDVSIDASASIIGLHSLGLTIHSVVVNGSSSDFRLAHRTETIPTAPRTMIEAAERTFASYLDSMASASKPELEIKLAPLPLPLPFTNNDVTMEDVAKDGVTPAKAQRDEDVTMQEAGSHRSREQSPHPASSLPRPNSQAAPASSHRQAQASGHKPAPTPPPSQPPPTPQRRLLVRIVFSSSPSFSAEQSSCTPSVSFVGGYAVCNPSSRRARSTFPCVDCPPPPQPSPSPSTTPLCLYSTYDIVLEVDPGHMAACSGTLLTHELVTMRSDNPRDVRSDDEGWDEEWDRELDFELGGGGAGGGGAGGNAMMVDGQWQGLRNGGVKTEGGTQSSGGISRRFHFSLPMRCPAHSIKFATGPYLPIPQYFPVEDIAAMGSDAVGEGVDPLSPMGGGAGGREGEGVVLGGLVMTHLSPKGHLAEAVAHSTKPLYLVVNEFQK